MNRCAVCKHAFTIGGWGVLGEALCHDDEWSCYTRLTQSHGYRDLTMRVARIRDLHYQEFKQQGRVRQGR